MEYGKLFLAILLLCISLSSIVKANNTNEAIWDVPKEKISIMPSSINSFAKEISDKTIKQINKKFDHNFGNKKDKIFIFISQSLTSKQIQYALKESIDHKNCIVVFYGLKLDQTMLVFSQWIHKMANNVQGNPIVIIDPLLFEQYKVSSVPTMVLHKPFQKNYLKKTGVLDVETLLDNTISSNDDELAPVKMIIERNLISTIKDKIKSYPWSEWKKNARLQFWKEKKSIILTPALLPLKRIISAKVQVTKDMVSPNGKVIARSGDVINQLNMMSMSRAYVVVNPTRAVELDWLKKYIEQQIYPPLIMFSNIPITYSWKKHFNLQKKMGAALYLLTEPVKERFFIQHTPSVIYAQNDHFLVEEVALDEN